MAFVSYVIENDQAFQDALDKAFKDTADLRIPFRQIARDFYRSEKAIFKLKGPGQYPDFKGTKVGKTWKNPGRPGARTRDPNLTPYQNYKLKNFGFIYPLLKATGDLEESLTEGGSGSILKIDSDSLTIGTTIPYANYHQQDSPDKGNRVMPTRKFLFIGPESRFANNNQRGRLDRWLKIINRHVEKTLLKRSK